MGGHGTAQTVDVTVPNSFSQSATATVEGACATHEHKHTPGGLHIRGSEEMLWTRATTLFTRSLQI